jgi:hypothetical protein
MTYRIETRGGGGGGDSGGSAEETVLVDNDGNFVANVRLGDDGKYAVDTTGGGDSSTSTSGGAFTLEDIINQSKSEKDVAFGTGRGQALGYAYELRNEDDEPYQRYDAKGNLTEFLNRVSGKWDKASDVKPVGTVFDPIQGKVVTQYQFGNNKFIATPGGPMGAAFAPVLESYSKDTSGWLGEGGWAKIGMLVAAAASAGLAGAAAGAGGAGGAAAGAGGAAATANAAESILSLTNLLEAGSTLATAADIAGQVVKMGTTAYDLLKDEHPEAAAVVKQLQDDVKTQTNAGESFDTAVNNAVNTTSGASDEDIRNVYRDVFGQEVTDEWLATQRATGLDKDTLANAYQGWEDADIRAAYKDVFGQEVTDEWLATQRASNLGKEGFTKAYQGWEDDAAKKQLPPPVVEQPPPVVEPPVVEPPVVEPPPVAETPTTGAAGTTTGTTLEDIINTGTDTTTGTTLEDIINTGTDTTTGTTLEDIINTGTDTTDTIDLGNWKDITDTADVIDATKPTETTVEPPVVELPADTTDSEEKDEDDEEKKKKKQQANSLSMQTVTVKPPPVAAIDYMYDIGGESIFATPKQESLMPSPFEETPEAVEGVRPRYQYYDPSGGYQYADGGMVDEGGEVTQEELEAALRPLTYNPKIVASGERSRRDKEEALTRQQQPPEDTYIDEYGRVRNFSEYGRDDPTLEDTTYRLTGMQPGLDRSTILPHNPQVGWHVPEFIYSGIKSVLSPEQAYKYGNVSPKESIETAMNVMGGGLGVSSGMRNPTGVARGTDLGMQIGPNAAKHWDQASADFAEHLLQQNFSPKYLKGMTGTAQFPIYSNPRQGNSSVTGPWANVGFQEKKLLNLGSKFFQEISDKDAVYKPPFGRVKGVVDNLLDFYRIKDMPDSEPTVKMSEVLKHPKLYEAYPEIKDMQVSYYSGRGENYGYYNPETGVIGINKNISKNNQLDTILHEIQHHIQKRESWSGGANPSMYKAEIVGKLSPEELAKLQSASPDANKIWQKIEQQAFDMYQRNQGEAAARATSARRNLDDRQIYGTPIKYDVPEHEITPYESGGLIGDDDYTIDDLYELLRGK